MTVHDQAQMPQIIRYLAGSEDFQPRGQWVRTLDVVPGIGPHEYCLVAHVQHA